jgi:hypothetical protein
VANERQIPTLWDSWHRLKHIFSISEDTFPEIVFEHVVPEQMVHCIENLLNEASDVSTSFMIPESRVYVQASSPNAALMALSSGHIVGAFGITLPLLPMLTIYVDQPERFSIGYVSGYHWNPIAMAALMLLLRDIRQYLPETSISLMSDEFTVADQYTFDQVVGDYL